MSTTGPLVGVIALEYTLVVYLPGYNCKILPTAIPALVTSECGKRY